MVAERIKSKIHIVILIRFEKELNISHILQRKLLSKFIKTGTNSR